MDQIIRLDFSKEKKVRTVCSDSIIWGNNHQIHCTMKLGIFNSNTTLHKNMNMSTKTCQDANKLIQLCQCTFNMAMNDK